MKLLYLTLIAITSAIEVKEVHEDVDERIPEAGTSLNVNASYAPPIDSITSKEMTRITHPTPYYKQVELSEQNTSASTPSPREIKNDTFNPSPEVTDFEYNRYQVPPAYPEAKQIPSVTFTPDMRTYLPPAPVPILQNNQLNNHPNKYLPPKPTMHYETAPEFVSVDRPDSRNHVKSPDQPYPFHSVIGHSGKGFSSPGHFSSPEGGHGHHGNRYGGHHGEVGKHGESPWKKVIHFITTLLPIGLFLTALTPSVLTITPVVNTDAPMK